MHRRGLVPDLSNAMPHYFDSAHRAEIETLCRHFTARTEWPTWLLLIGVYSGWFGIVLNSHRLGLWWSTLLLIPLLVLWLSVQHELLHGHPTRWPTLNKILGYAPFAVWYPYTLYRDSHLLHHRDEDLAIGVSALFKAQYPDLVTFFEKVDLPIDLLNQTLGQMSEKRQKPREVVEAFLREQPQVWKGWVPGEVVSKVSASL